MKTQKIGKSDLVSSRLSYGCMRVVGTWNPSEIDDAKWEMAEKAILAAYESGYTLFDHADIYCRGGCESAFGRVLKKVPSMRKEVIIATKCGIRFGGDPSPDSPHRYDFSKEHILRSCDQSLARLGVETIDIYQLHRPDLLMDPQEVCEAFEILHKQGKVRWFGVSNFLPSFVSCLQAGLPFPLVVNQVEIHMRRLNCFYDGTLDQCIEQDITPLSWSPLAGGKLGDSSVISDDENFAEEQKALLKLMDEMASKYGVSRTVIALAWLMKHPSKIIPIVGSAKPENIKAAAKADEIELDREDWYKLLVAARMKPLP